MDLSARIAAWRELSGRSHRDLAEAIELSPAAIYQWEGSGDSITTPSLPHLEAFVAALGLTMEQFYGRIPSSWPLRRKRVS